MESLVFGGQLTQKNCTESLVFEKDKISEERMKTCTTFFIWGKANGGKDTF
jgi:hypothetical protein